MMSKSACLSVTVAMVLAVASADQATVNLKVLDEDGKPVPNAEMAVIFSGSNWELDTEVMAKTNADGLLVAKGWSKDESLDDIQVFSKVAGYYKSRKKLPLMIAVDEPGKREFDLTLPLRKIGKPIAMYAKKVELELPEQRKEIGFDFEKGDWVKPFGEGDVADCVFNGYKDYADRENFRIGVTMNFPGVGAGMQLDPAVSNRDIQTSRFKTSRFAPADKYQAAHKFIRLKKQQSREGSTLDADYCFRSRTKQDVDGKILSCHYGKMLDAVNVARRSGFPDGNPIVSFTYYFNPTPNDRNLEFDPKKNLFGDLDWEQEVKDP